MILNCGFRSTHSLTRSFSTNCMPSNLPISAMWVFACTQIPVHYFVLCSGAVVFVCELMNSDWWTTVWCDMQSPYIQFEFTQRNNKWFTVKALKQIYGQTQSTPPSVQHTSFVCSVRAHKSKGESHIGEFGTFGIGRPLDQLSGHSVPPHTHTHHRSPYTLCELTNK